MPNLQRKFDGTGLGSYFLLRVHITIGEVDELLLPTVQIKMQHLVVTNELAELCSELSMKY